MIVLMVSKFMSEGKVKRQIAFDAVWVIDNPLLHPVGVGALSGSSTPVLQQLNRGPVKKINIREVQSLKELVEGITSVLVCRVRVYLAKRL
jgi:hypothetical protein